MTTTGYRPPPPPPAQRPRRRGGVVGPLILIFIGVVFLLQNAGYLPPNFWLNLSRLWPLILVLVGIELLLAHRLPRPALAALAVVVLVVGALVTNWTSPAPGAQEPVSRSTITSLGGATQAAVTVRFGAGELNIGALSSPGPDELASMDYQGPPQLAPQPRYTASPGGVGQLSYETFGPGSGRPGQGFFPFSNRGGGGQLNLSFAPNVPIASLVLQSGATDAHVDLSNLRVSTLDLSVGAATAWVRFPQAGSTTARISGGASTVTLQIPQGVAAQIQTRGGLSTVNIDQSRFPQVGDGLYRSADYDGAANRLDLTIETGITTIQVS